MDASRIPPEDLLACAARELKMRRNAYPKWVAAGRMQQAKADHEIACMAAIVAMLQAAVPSPQQRLFG